MTRRKAEVDSDGPHRWPATARLSLLTCALLACAPGCAPKHFFARQLNRVAGGHLARGGPSTDVFRMGATIDVGDESTPAALVVRIERDYEGATMMYRLGYWGAYGFLGMSGGYRWSDPVERPMSPAELGEFEQRLAESDFWQSPTEYEVPFIVLHADVCVVEAYVDGKAHFVERSTMGDAVELFAACDVLIALAGIDRTLVAELSH